MHLQPTWRHRWWQVFAASLILLQFPNSAAANFVAPSMFPFSAPYHLASITLGLSFIGIVLVEALILWKLLRLRPWKAALCSLSANAFSSLLGLFALHPMGWSCVLLPVLLFIAYEYRHFWKLKARETAALALAFPLTMILWAVLVEPDWRILRPWAFYGGLIPAFALSVMAEALVVKRFRPERPMLKPLLLANGLTYALLFPLLVWIGPDPLQNPAIHPVRLRALSAELAGRGEYERSFEVYLEHERRGAGIPSIEDYVSSLDHEERARIAGEYLDVVPDDRTSEAESYLKELGSWLRSEEEASP